MTKLHQRRIEHDWFPGSIPRNVEFSDTAYADTSYSFAAFHSKQPRGLVIGRGAGVYLRASFVVGPKGTVQVGNYSCLNGAYILCQDRVTIADHCLIAWGVVITDTLVDPSLRPEERRTILAAAAADGCRALPAFSDPQPVVIDDNVWIGFDSVVFPGVKLGEGCVIGCKSMVTKDVAPYAVYVGNPGRIVHYLDPTDTAEARLAFREHLREKPQ